MHGLVLAGGEGSRFAAGGGGAKALARINGVPQVARAVEACRRVGCATVTCAVREDLVDDVVRALDDTSVRIVAVRTPTSLHTLVAGLAVIGEGDVVCTLVDTVMPADDWDAAHAVAVAALATADAVVAVTPFIEDQSPLWVDVAEDGTVRSFGRRAPRELATGGVYWLNAKARAAAADSLGRGVQRLRGFLGDLCGNGCNVQAVVVDRIVDVDTDADLVTAKALIEGERR